MQSCSATGAGPGAGAATGQVEAAASTTDFVPIHMGDDDRNGAQAVCIGSRTDAQASLQEAGNLQTADGRGQNNAADTASEAQRQRHSMVLAREMGSPAKRQVRGAWCGLYSRACMAPPPK